MRLSEYRFLLRLAMVGGYHTFADLADMFRDMANYYAPAYEAY